MNKGASVMKYVVILGDGMAGYPLPAHGMRTCMQLARTPLFDELAKKSTVGLVKTVPAGFSPGSDVANLSVMGYDPEKYYTGRSPLEAASIGIPLTGGDVTFRCNLVTLSEEEAYADRTMIDYSAGEISTAEAGELIGALQTEFDKPPFRLYAGISYRHCLVLHERRTGSILTPPHDITGKPVREFLPRGTMGEVLKNMMERSAHILKDHPVNRRRRAEGKRPANSVWFWGEGTKPDLRPFFELYGKKGAVISAVDLIKGIGILAWLDVIEVAGATGNWDTNFAGKADAAIKALLGGKDFVYVHMEAPDECGHHGDVEKKVYSIEQVDMAARRVFDGLRKAGEAFAMLILPDHPTPIEKMTHTSDPVPFLLYRSDEEKGNGATCFDEDEAAKRGLFLPRACELMGAFLR